MIRVNTEQQRYTPWFAKAGAACSIIPISRFVNDRIFALTQVRHDIDSSVDFAVFAGDKLFGLKGGI